MKHHVVLDKPARLLSCEEIRVGQRVVVLPSGEGIPRGQNLGHYHKGGQEALATDHLIASFRRGTVLLFEHVEVVEEPVDTKESAS